MFTIKKKGKGAMKIVKPGDDEPQGKAVEMTTVIPASEEPVAWCMVVACQSGHVYVGHQPGQEGSAFALCLKGAETLHIVARRQLAEHQQQRVVPVHADLAHLTLPAKRES